uniref:Uncharacterized protein n=1 Tax=Tetranychus urticae TaxID=32264 RepID=T1JS34_TETUR
MTPDVREALNINATENGIAAITKILQYNSSQVDVNELLPLWFSYPFGKMKNCFIAMDFFYLLLDSKHFKNWP